jgi:hypothetical protein
MVVVEPDTVGTISLEAGAIGFALVAQLVLYGLRQIHAVGFVGLNLFVVIKHG